MKKKRIISWIAALIITLSGILMLPTTYAKAQEPEVTGYWELVDVYDEQSDSLTTYHPYSVEVLSGSAASGFTDVQTLTTDTYRDTYVYMKDRLHSGNCNGESGTAVYTFSPLPGSRLTPGEELAITANVSCSSSSSHILGVGSQVFISYLFSTSPGSSNVYFRTEDRGTSISPELIWQAEGSHSGGHTDSVGDSSGTYSATIPDGGGSHTDLYIKFQIVCFDVYITSYYHYQWVDTTPVASEQTEADDDHEPTIYITESENADEDTADSDDQTENDSDEAEPEDTGPIVQTVTQNADSDSGEDHGTDIITAIILGVGGALAGAGAVGASSGGSRGSDSEEEKKKKAYRMKVYKNFGDGIQKGAKPVTVWARIVEITDGGEENRPDLSEKITVSGTGMDVRSAGMQNTYMGAEVSVPADSQAQTATLTFTFTGEGGIFRNNIVFQVLGEPEITFPAVSEDGRHWDVNSQNNQVDLIAGARVSERLRFVITNAAQEPKAIRFTADREGLDITWEKDTQWQYTYYACIENRTAPIEKENGIFADMISASVRIDAEFENGLTIWSYIIIRLFPEGLSAQGELTNGRLTVTTTPREDPEEGFAKISPTVFSLTLAYPDGNGHAVVVEGISGCTPKKLEDDGKYGLMFTDNFQYTMKYPSASQLAIYPENTLPSLGDGYEVYLPLAVDTGRTGRDYSADLPLTVMGEVAKPVYSDAKLQKELELLKKDVKFFGLDGNPEVTNLVRLAASGYASVDDIQNARKAVITSGVSFYIDYGDAYRNMDKLLSQYIVIAGTMVKAGDFALEYVLKAKLGTYGGLAAKIINPLKNLFATFIGEIYADGEVNQDPYYYAERFTKTLLKGCEDALYTAISGVIFDSEDLKKGVDVAFSLGGKTMSLKTNPFEEIKNVLGYVISVYLMIRFIDHYFYGKENEKGDVFRSMVAACSDLTFKLLKDFVIDRLMKMASRVFAKLMQWCGDIFKKFCQGQINQAVLEAGDKAFGDKIKQGLIADGQITYATYRAAKTAKALAKRDTFTEAVKKYDPKPVTDAIINWKDKIADDKRVGTALNILIGVYIDNPDKKDKDKKDKDKNDEGFKVASTKDVLADKVEDKLTEYAKTYLGITPERVTKVTQAITNPLEATVRLENGKLILGMLGYELEFLMTGENFLAVAEMAFESLFSWLDAYWDMMVNAITVPDPRKAVEKNIDRIRQELEAQKKRMESLEDVEFKYTGT